MVRYCKGIVTLLVAKIIKSRTKSDDLLRHIHTLVLGRPNKKTDVKGNLLAFNGGLLVIVPFDNLQLFTPTTRVERS